MNAPDPAKPALRLAAVTGANGFVGRALVRRLLHEGISVRALLRDAASPSPPGADRFVLGDLASPAGLPWERAVLGCDAVFHLAAIGLTTERKLLEQVNVQATAALAKAAFASGVPLVYVSTVKVHGDGSAAPLTEASPLLPADDYGHTKLRAEQALARIAAQHGGVWWALRPPIVFGAGDRGNFARLLRLAQSRWPLPLASVNNHRSMIHVDVLADALLATLLRSVPHGRPWLVSGGPARSIGGWLASIGDALAAQGRRRPRLWPCPPGLLRAAAGLLGAGGTATRLLGSLAVDDSAWRQASGWQPPLDQDDAVARTVQQWLAAAR